MEKKSSGPVRIEDNFILMWNMYSESQNIYFALQYMFSVIHFETQLLT